MMYVEASTDGLPVIVAKLEGVAVYLDNWAIIELANRDAKRRERFVKALKSCGSLLFSFTNSIELGEAEREPAERIRTFLDEIGANWIPIELNPWTVMDREIAGQTNPTPCLSTLFMETFVKDRMYEQSPEGSKVADLSPENFFKLTSVMKWANAKKEETRKSTEEIDEALINRVADEHTKHQKDPSHLDKAIPSEPYSKNMPTRFALLHLLRLLVTEAAVIGGKFRALRREFSLPRRCEHRRSGGKSPFLLDISHGMAVAPRVAFHGARGGDMQMSARTIHSSVSRKGASGHRELGPDVAKRWRGEATKDRSVVRADHVGEGLDRRLAQMREANEHWKRVPVVDHHADRAHTAVGTVAG